MKVEFRESFFYEAWIVVSNFGRQNSYRIYIKVLDPGRPEIAGKQTGRPANLFANKHLREHAAGTLRKRTFKGASEYEKWDALETLGVKLNPHLEPVGPPSTKRRVSTAIISRSILTAFRASYQPGNRRGSRAKCRSVPNESRS